MSDSYFYYQVEGGEEAWQPCPAQFAPEIRKSKTPAYMTILSVSELIPENATHELLSRIKHQGPFYMDWDSKDDIGAAIEDARSTIAKLVDKGLDPRCIEIYATGGKGFHCVIPSKIFLDKMPKDGIKNLHLIYKKMAYDLVTDTLDMRVYSGRRGRMWREPNVVRPNGRFKVPVTWGELQAMDEEMYIDLTSAPRHYMPSDLCRDKGAVPVPTTPSGNVELTIMFDEASREIAERSKKKRNPEEESKMLLKWRDKTPPTLAAILAGEGLKPTVGFNSIAMQVVLTAQELKWSVERLLEEAKGLCEKHVSDGRNNSFDRRQQELARLWDYFYENVWDFSVGGIRSLILFDSPDLDGIVNDEVVEEVKEAVRRVESGETPEADSGDELSRNVDMRREGIYAIGEDSRRLISSICLMNPCFRISAVTGKSTEVRCQVYVDGRLRGTEIVRNSIFESRHSMNKFHIEWGSAFQGTDQHATSIMRKLKLKAESGKGGSIMYTIPKEGLDWVSLPNHENEVLREPFPVYVEPNGVWMPDYIKETNVDLGYTSDFSSQGIYNSDLMNSPDIKELIEKDSERIETTIRSLLTCQKKKVLSKLIGWYCAAYYRMFFHKAGDKYASFPLLHPFGQAGSGKTAMNSLLMKFHYYRESPTSLTPISTVYAIKMNIASSASIPLLIDEFKKRDMRESHYSQLTNLLKGAYNNYEIQMGGGTADSSDKRSIAVYRSSAPIVYIAESCEEMPAMQERSILCPVARPPESVGDTWFERFTFVQSNTDVLSALGKYMMKKIVNLDLATFRTVVDPIYAESHEKIMYTIRDGVKVSSGRQTREAANYAVVKFGLMSFHKALKDLFGDKFDEEMEELYEGVYEGVTDSTVIVMSEINKFIQSLAEMSVLYKTAEFSNCHLAKGVMYDVYEYNGRPALELNVTGCLDRYLHDCTQKRLTPLFTDANIIMGALGEHSALLKFGAERLGSFAGKAVVLDMDVLTNQKVEAFSE